MNKDKLKSAISSFVKTKGQMPLIMTITGKNEWNAVRFINPLPKKNLRYDRRRFLRVYEQAVGYAYLGQQKVCC